MFAYCPDNGPPRIIRFVDDVSRMPTDVHRYCGETPIVSHLDERTNVLTINRKLFERLDEYNQRQVEKTLDRFTTFA